MSIQTDSSSTPMRRLLLLSTALAVPASLAAQAIDTTTALGALRDAKAACEADAGRLWDKTMCGPIALVDRGTRLVVANDTVPGRRHLAFADAWVTTLPADVFPANFTFPWAGRPWTMVLLPLPSERVARTALVMHESFHREQRALGLPMSSSLNNHLDKREGRTWLRLEYHALADGVDALARGATADARRHAQRAMLFRAVRYAAYPGADSLERLLEMHEGLSEYTGWKLAIGPEPSAMARVARHVREYERTPTFVRAFAYGTGPGLGLLLDAFAPQWRQQVKSRLDVAAMLAEAVAFQKPTDVRRAAMAAAGEYGWAEIDRSEASRDSVRAPLMRDYRARLADGPTITIRQAPYSVSWAADPTALVGFDMQSTLYPAGTFSGAWGTLVVERGGALVWNDFSTVRIGAPSPLPGPEDRTVSGAGWTLTLNAGWVLRPDTEKPGSLRVVPR